MSCFSSTNAKADDAPLYAVNGFFFLMGYNSNNFLITNGLSSSLNRFVPTVGACSNMFNTIIWKSATSMRSFSC